MSLSRPVSIVNCWLLAALLLATSGSLRAADPSAGELELLAFGQGNGLMRMRFAVEVDGVPLATIWDEKFAALVAFFDRNGDQRLDEAETQRLPSVYALREVLGSGFAPHLGKSPDWKQLDANNDGQADTAEVAVFYRRAGLGVPLVGAGLLPHTAELTNSLLGLLDTDGNQRMEEQEWKQAQAALQKLDRNDDELVGAGELVSRVLYPGASGSFLLTPPQAAARALPDSFAHLAVMTLSPDANDKHWVTSVLQRLDRNHDGALEASEVNLQLATLKALDTNNDERLSAEELAAWRNQPADAICQLKLVTTTMPPTVEATLSGAATKLQSPLAVQPGLQATIRTDDGKLPAAIAHAKERFTEQFTSSDTDKDQSLSADEQTKSKANVWPAVLISADRNSDGNLARDEFEAWLALQAQLARGQLLLTVLDCQAGIFELLDANHDGALSILELRQAGPVVAASGAVKDGLFDAKRLPQQLLITASAGYPQSPLGVNKRTGPAWFLAMDRNGDGSVSRR
ncbi:MAG TPA: EF-hand domain-containing protein, partial [Pirellulaceae bacterium]|nr:EF-hand domain-containing protein [Pirellulaceae bacterium]